MGRIEKTVFISYRRTDPAWALAVFGDLTRNGYDVFIDFEGIGAGNFETIILENIRARAHFLVLLTPTALERCGDPKDWMRREIEAALDSQRNIVPLMLPGFNFSTPAIASQLTGKLEVLKQKNGLPIPEGYFSQAMDRLRNRFLNVPVDAVLHPASDAAQQAAKEQKDKATVAHPRKQPHSVAELATGGLFLVGMVLFACTSLLMWSGQISKQVMVTGAVVGAIVGWLAWRVVRGREQGLIGDLFVGIFGSITACWLLPGGGGLIPTVVNALIGAVISLSIWRLLQKDWAWKQ
jgi:uncharacterized membrane protein YeaQ/YmgE (transglycosylase-associated protein family)